MPISVGTITVAALSAASIVSAGDILTITGTGFPYVNAGTYVTDGLVAYYDGINNTGTGLHDNTSTKWKDLSNSGNDVTISNAAGISGWTCNGFEFPDNVRFERAGNLVKNLPVADENYSVELVWNPSHGRNFNEGGFIGWGKYNSDLASNKTRFFSDANKFRHYWWGNDFDFAIPNRTGVRQMSITYDNAVGRKAYAEAIYAAEKAIITDKKKNTAAGQILYIGHTGNMNTDANEHANGNLIHSVRIYNKPLTKTQIEHNYQVDKARYISPGASQVAVKIGNEACECLTIISATEMRCTLPPNSGIQNVTVSYGGANDIKVGEVSYKSIWLNGEKPKWLFINGQQVKAAWRNGQRVF
jgi:hypothetical protein